MRRLAPLALLALALTRCAPARPAGQGPRPDPGAAISTLFDAGAVYGSMGLIVAPAPLPFVATIRYLADATSDSTLALFGLSLANHSLSFQRDGPGYSAQYHVEVAFRSDTGAVRQFATDETVRVRTMQETQRGDESVIYQQFISVPPGVYRVTVSVRDRGSPSTAHGERTDTVPRLAAGAMSDPVAVYQGPGRSRASDVPNLLVNPRSTVPYGADSLRYYLEVYGAPPGARLAMRALDHAGVEVWRDTVVPTGSNAFATALVTIPPGALPVGEGRFEVQPVGQGVVAPRPTRFLVSFSDQWAITNFDEMISLLRYFERQDWVDKLRQAPPDQRPQVWREFYKATDPVPTTPENEALEAYFKRVQFANQRYREAGEPGWLTDRGEVYICLGEPDDVFDFSTDASRAGVRGVRWTYNSLRLTLFFQDQTGFGRFRLTPLSRAEFQRVLAQVRRPK